MNRERTLTREVTGTQIPSGEKQQLPAGTKILLHQTLGGSYTVQTDFGLFRIDGQDADSLGEKSASAAVTEQTTSDGPPDPEAVWSQLRQVYDPEIPVNIVDLGLVYSMDIVPLEGGAGFGVNVAMTLTAPGCGMGPAIAEDAKNKVLQAPGITSADVRLTWEPPWNQSMISEEGKMKLVLI